ncbi:hypothetical protein HYPSUDRAFT_763667 [Hypholoma sublateritium FD-334 SS-4]|uniref:Uncharacterized protein n=1 Tax=Hypholoma sublateritium (strain FD-334 SS-4) TaxID=945553 RepID=A0A0D2L2J4_HYPSF|nr:hypothetical protein HYPSUDRAFT_763667 [Hypholoma sublateritium FD-334 SS-4]
MIDSPLRATPDSLATPSFAPPPSCAHLPATPTCLRSYDIARLRELFTFATSSRRSTFLSTLYIWVHDAPRFIWSQCLNSPDGYTRSGCPAIKMNLSLPTLEQLCDAANTFIFPVSHRRCKHHRRLPSSLHISSRQCPDACTYAPPPPPAFSLAHSGHTTPLESGVVLAGCFDSGYLHCLLRPSAICQSKSFKALCTTWTAKLPDFGFFFTREVFRLCVGLINLAALDLLAAGIFTTHYEGYSTRPRWRSATAIFRPCILPFYLCSSPCFPKENSCKRTTVVQGNTPR